MKIAIDARCLSGSPHGIARYTENLLGHLPLEARDEVLVFYDPHQFKPWEKQGLQWLPMPVPQLSLREQWTLPRLLRQLAPDVFHCPSYVVPWSIPCPFVVTLHDLIHIHPEENYGPWHRRYYNLYLRKILKRSCHVLTVSEHSRAAIAAWVGAQLPVTVTSPGVSPHYRPVETWIKTLKKYPVGLPYLLFIGNGKPHKNFAILKKAFAMLRERHGAICNLLAIGVTNGSSQEEGIFYLSAVPEPDMPAIYSGARLLVCPSLREGFGLPVLEAMACGTPVVVSRIPPLVDIVGTSGLLFDPQREMTLLESILLILSNPQLARHLGKQGRERAMNYSWQKMAQQTWQVYRHCAESR